MSDDIVYATDRCERCGRPETTEVDYAHAAECIDANCEYGADLCWGNCTPADEIAYLRAKLADTNATIAELTSRIRDVADNLLGLQEVANPIELLDRIETQVSEERVEANATIARLRGALADAANSLLALSNAGGRHDLGLADMIDVRGYAHSRAAVARRALATDTTNDPLHPTGRCTCGGEGRCEWCRWRDDG